MKYLSTRNKNLRESFSTILFQGLSKEGGLFLPDEWPLINVNDLRGKTYEEIAFQIIFSFLNEDIEKKDLKQIIIKTYKSFNHPQVAPIINLNDNKFILELFHGPTLAFKDYALQFLGNIFSYFLDSNNKNITILGATSGDTGSAAIEAFKGKKNIQVFILHPHNMVSDVQRRQMTTIQDINIHNIAIKGTFDDCQKMVKKIFFDKQIQLKTSLTAINSINWVRIIAQSVYFFWAYAQLNSKKISFIVPSGNFGNIFSARVAKYMNLPIEKLHLVTNSNDILHKAISTGKMAKTNVKKTYSPSMDIQVSSNFERQIFESLNRNSDKLNNIMKSFYENGFFNFSKDLQDNLQSIYNSYSVSDNQILETIRLFKNEYNYLSDPHTSTGLYVLNRIKSENPIVSLACAHPSKFGSVIKKSIGTNPKMPLQLKNIFDKKEKFNILENNEEVIRKYILDTL